MKNLIKIIIVCIIFNLNNVEAFQGNRPFVTTWRTNNPGGSNDDQITFFGQGNFDVDWGDGTSSTGVNGSITHTFPVPGVYTISITGDIQVFNIRAVTDPIGELVAPIPPDVEKIISIDQWGDIIWQSTLGMFANCINLQGNFSDAPDLSQVTDLSGMFENATSFNHPINDWDLSNALILQGMFTDAVSFNQDIGDWDVSNAVNFGGMFNGATSFNQDIGRWDVSNAIEMRLMFNGATSFNQNIGDWDVSNVVEMIGMFQNAVSFDQDIGDWDVRSLFGASNMFDGVTLSLQNYDALLIGWNQRDLRPGVTFSGGFSQYCDGEPARTNMINSDGWRITDGGLFGIDIFDLPDQIVGVSFTFPPINGTDLTGNERYYTGPNGTGMAFDPGDVVFFADFPSYPVTIYIFDSVSGTSNCFDEENFNLTINENALPFVTTWDTRNPGVTGVNQISIPTEGIGYDYNVDWGDGSFDNNVNGDIIHTYAVPGIYTVTISGDFPRIFFAGVGDREKIITIEQWGEIEWASMEGAFFGCTNLQGNFSDSPDLSNVNSLDAMFAGASLFNHPINNWDVSTIVDMDFMFFEATSFNQDLSNWITSNVLEMRAMFGDATSFNGNIDGWDVNNVISMRSMFSNAISFNRNISAWNVGNVTDMTAMFFEASQFNQDISNWDVGNVVEMISMFDSAISFNQNIGRWDVSNVTNIAQMFNGASSFNGNIGNWDVSSVAEMLSVFQNATSFNQNIGGWDVSNVMGMIQMFNGATSFNQDIGDWDVNNVTNMRLMFQNAISFDQDIGDWDVSNVVDATNMFEGVRLSVGNYDALLIGWNERDLQTNVPFSGGNSQFCAGEAARLNMIESDNWVITDAGSAAPFIVDLEDQNAIGIYTLPPIQGDNLTGGERYYTEPNGQGIAFDAGDVINFEDFDSYPVTLYIYDELTPNCFAEENFNLIIERDTSNDILFPLFLTPNGDNINDTWNILSSLTDSNTGVIFIFDRFGKLITQISTSSEGWDGTFNGEILPTSDYWFRFENLNNEVITGHFTLKR